MDGQRSVFYLLTYLVVNVAVGEHCVEVLYALTCTAVEVVLQTLFYGPHVHGLFDNFMVILKKDRMSFSIYGFTKHTDPKDNM